MAKRAAGRLPHAERDVWHVCDGEEGSWSAAACGSGCWSVCDGEEGSWSTAAFRDVRHMCDGEEGIAEVLYSEAATSLAVRRQGL